MASYDYRIRVESSTKHWEVSEEGGNAISWTHETATKWCHEKGMHNATAGTRIVIERTRRDTLVTKWVRHRAYVVQDNGIVRRTDRTSQKA